MPTLHLPQEGLDPSLSEVEACGMRCVTSCERLKFVLR